MDEFDFSIGFGQTREELAFGAEGWEGAGKGEKPREKEICPSGCLGLGEEKKLPIEKPACDENSEKAVNWFFE